MSLSNLFSLILKGGSGSGNFGHGGGAGGPGNPGGSAPKGGIKLTGIPKDMVNSSDGGIGPSIQYHGTSNQNSSFDNSNEVYLTPQPNEAKGYAQDLHRFGDAPKGGVKKREMLVVRRKPGSAINVDDKVTKVLMNDDDIDTVITKEGNKARKDGYRYLYFTHPSFSGSDTQNVVISLYPKEDLKILKREKVK